MKAVCFLTIKTIKGVFVQKKLYIGNLPWQTTTEDLKNFFAPHGEVKYAKVIVDHDTGRSRGFGFVEMTNADKVIEDLNGTEMGGRQLRINEAKVNNNPRPTNNDSRPVYNNTENYNSSRRFERKQYATN
jgi:RNA recognition motif-containing protein